MNDRKIIIRHKIEQIKDIVEKVSKKSTQDPSRVKIMAVSKTMPVDDIVIALECGIQLIGENMVQEAQIKYPPIKEVMQLKGATFHFIGHLQSNKAKLAAELFDSIDSIDKIRTADKLNACANEKNKKLKCLIQANVAKENTKYGADEDDIRNIVKAVATMTSLEIQGFFAIPPYSEDPEQSRIYFRSLRMLRDTVQREFPHLNLSELSMGMSHDYHVAIEEGATIIRIGQGIFGEREKK